MSTYLIVKDIAYNINVYRDFNHLHLEKLIKKVGLCDQPVTVTTTTLPVKSQRHLIKRLDDALEEIEDQIYDCLDRSNCSSTSIYLVVETNAYNVVMNIDHADKLVSIVKRVLCVDNVFISLSAPNDLVVIKTQKQFIKRMDNTLERLVSRLEWSM